MSDLLIFLFGVFCIAMSAFFYRLSELADEDGWFRPMFHIMELCLFALGFAIFLILTGVFC